MKKIKLVISAFALFAVISSCKKPDDIKPEILVESPVNGRAFPTGGQIEFKASFTDNRELKQYKINIEMDDDGTTIDRWEENLVEDISGKSESVTKNIPVPSNVASGPYKMTVHCVDASGNEANLKVIDIIILG